MDPHQPFSQDDRRHFVGFPSNDVDDEYGEEENEMLEKLSPEEEDDDDDDDEAEDSNRHPAMPPPTGIMRGMNPPIDTKDKSEDDKMDNDGDGAPWTVDWTAMAGDHLQKALEEYKLHAKNLFQAITTFVDESNAVHNEWTVIQDAEQAESRRLDEVEPDVFQATHGEQFEDFPSENDS